MGGYVSGRQLFLVAVALGFIGGFAWVSSMQPLMQGTEAAYATAD